VLRDVQWDVVERALNDPDLRAVHVSWALLGELVEPGEDGAEFLRLPVTVPGRVMVMFYDRPRDNVKLMAFDAAGAAAVARLHGVLADGTAGVWGEA
jgi:hypothetical protein